MSANPNIRTGAFGPPTWHSMVLIAMGYPKNNPTKEQRRIYKQYFTIIGEVLPCNLCRTSYRKFIKQVPLSPIVLSSRKKLVFWIFKIHNLVNKKLGCKQLKRDKFEKKYKYFEQFRATNCSKNIGGCIKADPKVKLPRKIKIMVVPDRKAKAKVIKKKNKA
jgi:hypothetical protein